MKLRTQEELKRALDHFYPGRVAIFVAWQRGQLRTTSLRETLDRQSGMYRIAASISDAQIEKVLGQKIFWHVPNQYPQVVKTIHEGDPVGQLSSSEVTQNLKDWAENIGKRPRTEVKKKEGKGILGLWNR